MCDAQGIASSDPRSECIDRVIIAAIDLRDLLFDLGDENIIYAMDLLIFSLGQVAAEGAPLRQLTIPDHTDTRCARDAAMARTS